MIVPLTLEHTYDIAGRVCAPHRADILQSYESVRAWAQTIVKKPGTAWALVAERPMLAGGVLTDEQDVGVLWMAGAEGWQRHAKHAIRICRAILTSGTYRSYECEVHEADQPSRRFAERLGFREIRTRDHLVLYGVTP